MRVIAGVAKGRRLFTVPGQSTRPITDRVKEALFDILAGLVVGSRFLDLFAGTGAVGIEALSRGASEAVFVEQNARTVATLKRNLLVTELAQRARVVRKDVFTYLAQYHAQAYDIIYVAPPQYKGLWSRTILLLDHSDLLANQGIIVAQIFPKEYTALSMEQLVLSEQRKYGSTLLCFYARPTA